MVYIIDEGSVYDAPLDRVWRLGEAHAKDASRIHPGFLNYRTERMNESTMVQTWDTDVQGQKVSNRARLTAYPPVGLAIEILEGPLAGSKVHNYHVPKGDRTGATVVGDFRSAVIPEDQLKPSVLAFLEQSFNEDAAYLRKMP
jgi:hypothetical protein